MTYYDNESDEYVSTEYLLLEYQQLKAAGNTEAESFGEYLRNCLDGSLERVNG